MSYQEQLKENLQRAIRTQREQTGKRIVAIDCDNHRVHRTVGVDAVYAVPNSSINADYTFYCERCAEAVGLFREMEGYED